MCGLVLIVVGVALVVYSFHVSEPEVTLDDDEDYRKGISDAIARSS